MYYRYLSVLVLTLALAVACFMPPAQADEALDEALTKIQQYEVGQDPAPMQYIIGRVLAVQGNPEARAAMAERLAKVLATDANFECKKFICRQLYIIGTEAQIPALMPLLTNADYTNMARYALKNLPGDAVTAALLGAVYESDGMVRVGLINDLGERRNAVVVPALATMLRDEDPCVAKASMNALAEISGGNALRHLRQALGKQQDGAAEAYLACLQNMERAMGHAAAGKCYTPLYSTSYPAPIRMAALSGMVSGGHANALTAVLDALRSDDPRWYQLGLAEVRQLTDGQSTRTFVNLLEDLPAERHAAVLAALADSAVPDRDAVASARKAALRAMDHENPAVRVAGLKALASLGTPGTVNELARAAATRQGAEQDAAREALATLRGEGVNTAILKDLDQAGPEEAKELLRTLAARHAMEAIPALLNLAETGTPEIRTASLDALAVLAGKKEMGPLVRLLQRAENDAVREAVKTALVSIARRLPDDAEPVLEIVQAAQLSSNPYHVAACFEVLGAVGHEDALPVLQGGLECPDATIRGAAIAALSAWPTPAPLKGLLEFAKATDAEADRTAALAACARMARMPSDRSAEETVPLLKAMLDLSDDVDVQRAVLSALGSQKGPDALALASSFLDNETLAQDAAVAVENIRKQGYVATASDGQETVAQALDGNMSTRWTTGAPQTPGQWFQLDLGYSGDIGGVVLNAAPSPGDYPRGYEVYVFTDPDAMGNPVAKGTPHTPVTEITFDPTQGRYVRIVQTGSVGNLWWSIHEIRLIAK